MNHGDCGHKLRLNSDMTECGKCVGEKCGSFESTEKSESVHCGNHKYCEPGKECYQAKYESGSK